MTSAAVLAAAWLAAAGAASVPAPAPIAWQWDGGPDLFPRLDLAVGKYAVALKKKKVILRGPSWSVEVVGRRDHTSGAALVTDGARVFVAVYNRATSGCSLAAFDSASGKQLWSVPLEGIGPIGHSAYGNRVEMRIISGHPTVFGNEWAKRYVEQRDAATGALVSHQLLPPERRSDPISERLFREVDLMLGKRPVYTVKVNDFLSRHKMMKDAGHAARGAAFIEAVGQLERLRRFEIKLVDTGGDFEVTAKRLP